MAIKARQCPLGKPVYVKRSDAEAASPNGEAEKCGRCNQWHPKVKKGRKAQGRRVEVARRSMKHEAAGSHLKCPSRVCDQTKPCRHFCARTGRRP